MTKINHNNFATQFARLAVGMFPLMALGEVLGNDILLVCSTTAFFVLGLITITTVILKKKCPQWLPAVISNGCVIYNVFCLPQIIYVCSNKESESNLFNNDSTALIFGFAFLILSVCIDIYRSRRSATKNQPINNENLEVG